VAWLWIHVPTLLASRASDPWLYYPSYSPLDLLTPPTSFQIAAQSFPQLLHVIQFYLSRLSTFTVSVCSSPSCSTRTSPSSHPPATPTPSHIVTAPRPTSLPSPLAAPLRGPTSATPQSLHAQRSVTLAAIHASTP
jgi:hypothetical protein